MRKDKAGRKEADELEEIEEEKNIEISMVNCRDVLRFLYEAN